MKRTLLLCSVLLASVTFASAQTASAKKAVRPSHNEEMIAKKKQAQLDAAKAQKTPLTQPLVDFTTPAVLPAVSNASKAKKQN